MRTTERARIHENFHRASGRPPTDRPITPSASTRGSSVPVRRPLRPPSRAGRQGIPAPGPVCPAAPRHADRGNPDPRHLGHRLLRRRRSRGRRRRHRFRARRAVLGALADRLGQRPVLLVSAVLNAVAVLAVIAATFLVPGRGTSPPLAVSSRSRSWQASAAPRSARWPGSGGWPSPPESRRTGGSSDLDRPCPMKAPPMNSPSYSVRPSWESWPAWWPRGSRWPCAAALTLTLVPAFAVHRTHTAVPRARRCQHPRPQRSCPHGNSVAACRRQAWRPGRRGTPCAWQWSAWARFSGPRRQH